VDQLSQSEDPGARDIAEAMNKKRPKT